MAERHLEVFVRVGNRDQLAGELWAHRRGRRESSTFAYATSYLQTPGAYELDPTLELRQGPQQTPQGKALFGAFTDCAPDRWGRRLVLRARRQETTMGAEAERTPGEIDFLLGVRDDLRQGALRFREPNGGFLADEETGVPHLTDLPRLLSAAERLERDEPLDADLTALLKGGSSLGGARPKAHVIDGEGRIAIAKFPRPEGDDWDVMRWEAVALDLAAAAGIRIPAYSLLSLDRRAVLVVRRFDRTREQARIGYASAMTMLEASEGDVGSYLDIADVVTRLSPRADEDLPELWRRIAFTILISNTDDHLRNHGFLRDSTAGWSLAPAFDLNPDPEPGPKTLSTMIDFESADASIATLMEIAEEFRLGAGSARDLLGEVVAAVTRWRDAAAARDLSKAAIEQMSAAFEHDRFELAMQLTS